jgi:hypothetical protein
MVILHLDKIYLHRANFLGLILRVPLKVLSSYFFIFIYYLIVSCAGVGWIRVLFDPLTQLALPSDKRNTVFLKITSLEDGASQFLTQTTLLQVQTGWRGMHLK